ncbi:MAG TPA: hypothetical protein VFS44_08325 [Gemmatimonadaceae bacterium]|nr:hypothetical protein [Gemmatimonadaceae bacterium]
MPITDDPDFLTNAQKQLTAVQELANLRTRLVDLEAELLARRHERRALLERLVETDLGEQSSRGRSRPSRTAATERARASQELRNFDMNLQPLREKIARLRIEVERFEYSLRIAIASSRRGRSIMAA